MTPQTIQPTPAPNHKRRTILIATIVAVVIIAIGVWAIVSAINSVNTGKSGGTIVAGETTETTPQPESMPGGVATTNDGGARTGSSAGSSSNSPANQYTPTNKTTDTPAAAPATPDNVPSTGPEDILPAALLIGVAVYLVGTYLQLNRERANLDI